MIPSDFEVPNQWNEINTEQLTGTTIVIGPPDSGKSTMVRWLFNRLCQTHPCVGWLDGDIGQATLGVPATISLALFTRTKDLDPYLAATIFVGSTSPRGHMNSLIDGLLRLQKLAIASVTAALVVDTTGMLDEHGVGNVLKRKKIQSLQPSTIIALQRGQELEHIISFLKTEHRINLHVFSASEFVVRKSPEQRARNRSIRFRRYFQSTVQHRIEHDALPVSGPQPLINSLMAFQDKMGFTLALGVVLSISSESMEILTPLSDMSNVAGLRFCALRIDPFTGEEL
jgi:polynucleotide 5'-kinase involved in rRNA processing